jgi:hypothetical protein
MTQTAELALNLTVDEGECSSYLHIPCQSLPFLGYHLPSSVTSRPETDQFFLKDSVGIFHVSCRRWTSWIKHMAMAHFWAIFGNNFLTFHTKFKGAAVRLIAVPSFN